MPYCRNCGTEVQLSQSFCQNCGRPLGTQAAGDSPTSAQPAEAPTVARTSELATIISAERIVLMTVITYGAYPLYWFYLTWKHYRDHTRREAYPVCHALTLLVPIYGLFRTHAHIRSYKELALNAGVPTSLSPGWVVAGVAASFVLDWVSGLLVIFPQETGVVVAAVFLSVLSLAIVALVVVSVQSNLNAYWKSMKNITVASVRTGVGEIILGVLGVVAWLGTILAIIGLT
ncbi:MAG: zinc ribbon domain-containing protein [Chloroflexi bacterium]|nr:zinc ribbon domain-containing protein [Chloroflexota bacterium]